MSGWILRVRTPFPAKCTPYNMPHEGVALKRLFLDGDHDRFILRTEQPAHPGVALLPQDCPGRILGRVSWVLQNV